MSKMLYNLGSWKSYIFGYNDVSGECKLIKKSGVDSISSVVQDINKIKVLYHFMEINDGIFVKPLMTYTLHVKNYGMNKFEIYIHLCIKLIPRNIISDLEYKTKDYVIFVEFSFDSPVYARLDNSNELFIYIASKMYKVNLGIVIPQEMLFYIMRLYLSRDCDGILDAFNGFLSNRLLFLIGNSLFYPTGHDEVIWG